MLPRILSLVLMAATIASTSPASAEPKEKAKAARKQAARTWKNVVDYVIANGSDRELLSPTTQLLGFNSEEVATKALRYKSEDSPDKMSHAVYVISDERDGTPAPREIVLGNRISVTKDGVKSINDFLVRTDLTGKIISAATSKGPAGQVKETILSPNSPIAVAGFNNERTIYLETVDLHLLRQ